MGASRVSDRKLRRAAQATGLPILGLIRVGNREWLATVAQGDGHAHVEIDPVTWEWRPGGGCWSSCDTATRRTLYIGSGDVFGPDERSAAYETVCRAISELSNAWVRDKPPSQEVGLVLVTEAWTALAYLAAAANVPLPRRFAYGAAAGDVPRSRR